MKKDINGFEFWCPAEITKAIDENTGEEIMLLDGIASTADEDSDGEFLDPKGFDIKPLLEKGFVNWHHQAKTNPETIVGEPVKAEIRKDGLYIKVRLYNSSKIAREIWDLAQTLDKDSKTRRLGYSIEGKVLQRESEDKTDPGYKKITKAIITGVAITHQPKNSKTFANIIKGDIDEPLEDTDDEKEKEEEKKITDEEEKYYEGVGVKKKSLDTDAGRPLIREDVDPKIKVLTFGKSEVMERLFQDIPGISIEKATEIYSLIKKIANMSKRKMVTDEDITKAYGALGLSPDALQKGEDATDTDKDDEEQEQEDAEEQDDVTKGGGCSKGEDEVDEESEEDADEDDEEEDTDDEAVTKALIDGRFDRIEKALAVSHMNQSKYIKALGVMVKAQSQDVEKAVNSLNLANKKIDEQAEIIKAQQNEISTLSQRLESFGNYTPGGKAIRHSNPVERNFNKGQEDEFGKQDGANRVSIKNRAAVSEILDQATFAKGYDDEFSKACTAFEATGQISPAIISRVKNEFNIDIV